LAATLAVATVAACGGSATAPSTASPSAVPPSIASSAPAASKPAPAASTALANPSAASGGQAQMSQLVAAAKKEGKLILGSSPDPAIRQQVLPLFEKEYGIQAQELSFASGAPLANKLVQEQAAGQHTIDVTMMPGPPVATTMLPAKLYAPLKPALILPDVSDPSKWAGGKLPYFDPQQQYVLKLVREVRYIFSVNTTKIDVSQFKSANDMLQPSLKGKIAAYDPTLHGPGQSVGDDILRALGPDYFKKLYLGQQIKYGQDDRTMGDWVAQGTYPIGMGLGQDVITSQVKAGFKVAPLQLASPGMATANCGSFLLGMINQAPHPSAAKLFANWLLTQQGMQALSDAEGEAVIRLDVNTSKLHAADIPGPDYTKLPDDCGYNYVTTQRTQLTTQLLALTKGT